MVNNFIIWVELQNEYLTYNYETKQFGESITIPTKINSFYLPKSYEIKKKDRSDDMTPENYIKFLKSQIISYSEHLIKDVKEILDFDLLKINFDYFAQGKMKNKDVQLYRSHYNNVRRFLKQLLKDKDTNKYKYEHFDDVYYSEYNWFKQCYNAGLIYLKEKDTKYFNTFGYDFKMSYPTDMASIGFQIPTKKGKEIIIKEFPTNLKYIKYGIYRVRIESDDEKFKQVFMFSDNNSYTHYSLKFALKMSKKFNINIKLIHDGSPNAYVYERTDLISGNKLFGNWYYRLVDMKGCLPSNGIVKLLSSSAWGHINQLKTITKNTNELKTFMEEGNTIGTEQADSDYVIVNWTPKRDTVLYELVKRDKPVYDMPIRLLPFITSFSRSKMGNLIDKYNLFDKVIRIQTDSITFSEQFNEKIDGFNYDSKISGNIHFKSLNNYWHFEEEEPLNSA